MTALETARAVADAVLYEGYVLYPYRATSSKNQVRFQWGVLMPADVVAHDPSERASNRTSVVVDGRASSLSVTVRFLQVQQRTVLDDSGQPLDRLEAGDTTYLPWDEAREGSVHVAVPLDHGGEWTFDIDGGTESEDVDGGRLLRTRLPLRLGVTARVEHPVSPYPVTLVSLDVINLTPSADLVGGRPVWLRRSLVACHLLLSLAEAAFVSLLEPPEWARAFVAASENDGVFPVPCGSSQVMLSSPIILYDYPTLAPESETAFFDALEIDELLSLRTMTLSEEEKREVRGTDPRAAALLRDVDDMPADLWDRLHGTVRYLSQMTGAAEPAADVPWWDPGSDASVDPEQDEVMVGDIAVSRGTRVILRPGVRRADAYDLFLAGRRATVAAVLHDVDDKVHLAVTVDEDPGVDLKIAHGRYLYFAPDEVEPLRLGVGP